MHTKVCIKQFKEQCTNGLERIVHSPSARGKVCIKRLKAWSCARFWGVWFVEGHMRSTNKTYVAISVGKHKAFTTVWIVNNIQLHYSSDYFCYHTLIHGNWPVIHNHKAITYTWHTHGLWLLSHLTQHSSILSRLQHPKRETYRKWKVEFC